IRDTEKGILVCGVLGGGQSNVLAGDFSVNLALAFLIEKGELRGRVKNAMFGGNLYQLQPNLRELSREVQDVYGHMRLPYMVFERVKVAGKA
ncbi:TldD/PmbA family protein, partial [bacterium]